MSLPGGVVAVARPTLDAIASVEDERGPVVEIVDRMLRGFSWGDTVAVLDACTGGVVGRDEVLEMGIAAASTVAIELVATVFDPRAAKLAAKDGEGSKKSDDGRLAADRMTGIAVALWHVSPRDAWQMTVPEWWDAAMAYREANGKPDRSLSADEIEALRADAAEAPPVLSIAEVEKIVKGAA